MDMTHTYWNNKGKFQSNQDALYKKLVPPSHDAPTMEGELLRNIARFYHERYNNGHMNPTKEEREFLNRHIAKTGFKGKIMVSMSDEKLEEAVDRIVVYVDSMKGRYHSRISVKGKEIVLHSMYVAQTKDQARQNCTGAYNSLVLWYTQRNYRVSPFYVIEKHRRDYGKCFAGAFKVFQK